MIVDLGINIVDLYIRVSTTEQAEEGYSVEKQENKLRAYCEAYGYKINKVCVDPGYSGATLERPALKELIADVKAKKCNRVLVWKLDRLSRSQKDTLILLEDVFMANGCDFISLMEAFDTSTAFGRCIVGILAAFAQMERENIKARTSMGRIAKIKKGYFGGSHCPIGYRFKEGCNELIVDPYYSVIIRDVYKMFLSGYSLTAIGKAVLDKYGDRSYDWSKNTAVKRILSIWVRLNIILKYTTVCMIPLSVRMTGIRGGHSGTKPQRIKAHIQFQGIGLGARRPPPHRASVLW